MRIADTVLSQAITSQLDQQQASIATLEEQVASGQALNLPSDNPPAVTQVLQLSGQSLQIASWQANAQTAQSWLGLAATSSNSALGDMQSARTLLLQALNQGTQSPATYQGIAEQLQGVQANLLSAANTQYEGRPVFGGTTASSQAYDASGNYLGNGDTPTVVVGTGSGSGQTIDLSVPGTAMFGTGAASVFSTLSTAVAALQTGTPTTAQLTTALTALDANITTATQASAVIGTTAQQATAVSASLTTQLQAVTTSRSDLQDVNIATVTTQLDTQMTNYQAAMWAASQAIPESLVHFL